MQNIVESSTNIVAEGTRIEGSVRFDHVTRVHGTLVGDVEGVKGSQIIFAHSSVVEGNINADTVIIDGYVKGNIKADTKVTISGSGRVIGDITTPQLLVDFGAYFEGRCHMEN